MVTLLSFLILFSSTAFAKSNLVLERLPNGIKVYVLEDHNSPLVAIQICIATGSVNEDYKTRGISHFIEHLLFKGTKKRKVGEIVRELDAIGANYNASTTHDYTRFIVTGASCYFDKLLDIVVDGVLNSTLEKEEVEKERKVVIEEMKMDKNLFYNAVNRSLFDNLPYSFPIIGFQNIIENVPRDVIYSYYKEKYQPQNINVVIVGNIKPETAIVKLREAFRESVSTSTPNEKFDASLEEPISKPRYHEVRMDVEKTYLSIAYRGVPLDSPDRVPLEVLSALLGRGDSSRFNRILKEKNKLVDFITTNSHNMNSAGSFYTIMALDEKNIEKAVDIYLKEIEAVRNGFFTDDELERAKKQMESVFLFSQLSYNRAADYIGEIITLANEAKYNSYVTDVKKITKEDLKKATEKYLYPQGYSIVVLKPVKKNIRQGSEKVEK